MRSVKYLERVKERYGLKTDAALALKLGVGKSAVSHYMKGLRVMDEETCLAVALALDLNEHETMQVMMAAGIDRAEKLGQKSLWTDFFQRMAAATAVILVTSGVTLFLTPKNAEAHTYGPYQKGGADRIYIMSNPVYGDTDAGPDFPARQGQPRHKPHKIPRPFTDAMISS